VRVATNEGGTVAGYRRGDLIAYPEPDKTWSVEDGSPDAVPACPRLVCAHVSKAKALAALRGGKG